MIFPRFVTNKENNAIPDNVIIFNFYPFMGWIGKVNDEWRSSYVEFGDELNKETWNEIIDLLIKQAKYNLCK